jgi:hypothetical protein
MEVKALNHSNDKNQEQMTDKNKVTNDNGIGLDPEEQAMNGLYGMAETVAEDSMNQGNNQ